MGGVLPPTDPRILAMTEQQIDLDLMNILLDKEEKDEADGNKVYTDSSYDEDEAEEERVDSKLFIEGDFGEEAESDNSNDDEWVDGEKDVDDWEDIPEDELASEDDDLA